jgi:hypothetical protein
VHDSKAFRLRQKGQEIGVKDHLNTSEIKDAKGYESLRTRLDNLGSSIEFLIMDIATHVPVDETLHRRVFSALYDRIMADQRKWHEKIAQALHPAAYPELIVHWDVGSESGHALSPNVVHGLLQTQCMPNTSPSLYEEFCHSLYLGEQRTEGAKIQSLFSDWVDGLGIRDQSSVVVFNWTTRTDAFRRGSPLLGRRCLTIWNPVRRTLAALAICSTMHE